jgi:hypothetical protein
MFNQREPRHVAKKFAAAFVPNGAESKLERQLPAAPYRSKGELASLRRMI